MAKRKSSTKKAFFISLGIAFVLTSIVFSLYFIKQQELNKTTVQNTATAGWKTYENTEYGFSFKHPNLSQDCCSISGPLSGNPKMLGTFADSSTGTPGGDSPFNGFSVAIEPNEDDIKFET